MTSLAKWQPLITQLRQREDGVAYLEFALILPVLMMLFLGGQELTRYVQASQKVDKLTHTVVDLIAQAPTISTGDMNTIMQAAPHIMAPFNFAQNGVIIVSCIGYDSQDNLVVKWQHRGGGTLARNSHIGTAGQNATLPAGFVVEDRDNVIVAETYYRFKPIINEEYVSPTDFYRTAYYLPRLGELATLTP